MSGFQYAGTAGSAIPVPNAGAYLLANSLNGVGTPPAAQINEGDIVVLTTKTSLTSGANVVARMLLQADKAAHYKEGTPVAGILGVASAPAASNASGVSQALNSTLGGTIYATGGDGSTYGIDKASGRNYLKVDRMTPNQTFRARLDINSQDWPTGFTLQHQLDGTLAGIVINFNTWTCTWSGNSTLVVGGTGTGTYSGGTYVGGTATSIYTLGSGSTAAQVQTALVGAMVIAGYPASVTNNVTVTGTAGAAMTIFSPFPIFLYPGTAANVTLNGTGAPVYTVQVGTGIASVGTGAAALDECLRIIGPEESDPLYNTLCPVSTLGPLVLVEILGSFAQYNNGINYSTN